jgi:hypothetical protein
VHRGVGGFCGYVCVIVTYICFHGACLYSDVYVWVMFVPTPLRGDLDSEAKTNLPLYSSILDLSSNALY